MTPFRSGVGQALARFFVTRGALLDDLRRQVRGRRLLVPAAGLDPVANELLVERGRAAPRLPAVDQPETGRIGREDLVDQDQLAILVEAELELGVIDDDAAFAGVGPGEAVEGKGGSADLFGQLAADQPRAVILDMMSSRLWLDELGW